MELAVPEEGDHLEGAEVALAPGVEVGLEALRRPAGSTPREAAPEDLGVEALDIAGGEAQDVGAGHQGAEFGGGLGPPRGQLHLEGGGGAAHLRGAEGEGAGLGLQPMVAVAVPPAARGAPARSAPPQEGGDLLLEADLEHVLRRPGDELAEGVAQRGSLELGGQGFPHLAARWYPLHGVGAPFSVPWDGPVRHRKGTLRLSIFTPKIGHHPIEPFNLGKSLW